MSKKALLAVTETTIGQGFSDDYNTRGYIDASMVSSRTTGSARGGIKVFVNGSTSGAGSALIDAINAISASNTRITEINIVAENSKEVGNRDGKYVFVYDANLTIWIDWVALTVQWQGMWRQGSVDMLNSNIEKPGYSVYQGSQAIEALGSNVTIGALKGTTGYHGGLGGGPNLYLETGPNGNILKLPIFSRFSYSSWTGGSRPSLNSYTITTDTGINVTAAPTPPAETPTVAPVVGVKISELNAVDALQDDDLFVLSQDNASDGTYNASYNVTLSTLNGSGGWSSGWSAAAGNNTSSPYSHTLNSTDVVWQIYVAENDEGLNAIALDVQLDLQMAQSDTLGALLSDVTATSFNLQLGGGYFATLKSPQTTIPFSGKFVKVVGRRS